MDKKIIGRAEKILGRWKDCGGGFNPKHCSLHLGFFASGAECLSFYYPGSIPVVSTFAWVGYSISRDHHEEAVDMMRSRGANGRSHTNFLSPVLVPPSKWDTWFGGSRWWHCGLAQKNCTEYLMTRSAQTKKKTVQVYTVFVENPQNFVPFLSSS